MKPICLLSIIIPVYNVEKFLPDCLDSLLTQDVQPQEYEIICVDDGSKDSSPAILDQYAAKHTNIRVIHKENGGVSSARNVGMQNANGAYIGFVDADDYIRANVLGQLSHLMTAKEPDILRLDSISVQESSCFDPTQEIISLSSTETTMDQYPGIFYTSTEIIVKRSLIDQHGLRFSENLSYGEDTVFSFFVWQKADTIISIEQPLYYYRMRRGSAMHQYSKAAMNKRIQDLLYRAKLFDQYLQSTDQDAHRHQTVLKYQSMWSLSLMNALLLSSAPIKETLQEMQNYHMPPPPAHPLKIVFSKGISIKERLGMFKNIILIQNPALFRFWAYFFRIIPVYRWAYLLLRKALI